MYMKVASVLLCNYDVWRNNKLFREAIYCFCDAVNNFIINGYCIKNNPEKLVADRLKTIGHLLGSEPDVFMRQYKTENQLFYLRYHNARAINNSLPSIETVKLRTGLRPLVANK